MTLMTGILAGEKAVPAMQCSNPTASASLFVFSYPAASLLQSYNTIQEICPSHNQ